MFEIPQIARKQIRGLRSKSGILDRKNEKNTPKNGFVASTNVTYVDSERDLRLNRVELGERIRAEQERTRAEQERTRAEQERTRAERLATQLRALGIEPEA